MAAPTIPVNTNFCVNGIHKIIQQVIDGTLPLAVLCGDGVGWCDSSCQHNTFCLSHFTSMNIILTEIEVYEIVQKTLKQRNISAQEMTRIIQLKPNLQTLFLNYSKYRQTLLKEGELWVQALLTLDIDLLKRHSSNLPLSISGCVLKYMQYLNKNGDAVCCSADYCPMNTVARTVKEVIKLPQELINLILRFV